MASSSDLKFSFATAAFVSCSGIGLSFGAATVAAHFSGKGFSFEAVAVPFSSSIELSLKVRSSRDNFFGHRICFY